MANEREYWKPLMDEVDYRTWAIYVYDRLNGFEMRDCPQVSTC